MTRLPTRHDEEWRWADLRHADAFAGTPAPANDSLPDAEPHWLDLPGERRLFAAGHAIDRATETPEADPQAPQHPLADLARVAATAGTRIALADGEDGGTVQILHIGTTGSAHGVTRLMLGAGARLTLIESFADDDHDHWLNHRLDAELGAGASLTRIVRLRTSHGLVSERAYVTLGPDARFTQLAVASANGSARSEVLVRHDGAGAHADVNGILLGDGAAALDALTRLEHRVPDTTSGQVWRLVAAGKSQLSVSGGVNVARHAQKTDAEQSLKALVLKRTASANLKPELEIFADDVKCAHGCTVGELDRAGLFYLQSRGIPPHEAEALLTRAFVADALSAIADPALREALDTETRLWLEQRT
ncbi:SufB/SufD family protein [Sandaracinobacteroides hominis]|uniref:SufB/SufD family protein n=1 Tax=Sandaracinobacteroides hominis TaxID=2780086 RepID=UPI0018F48A61|nr:SufD family Fe-S cluster assembly protein [Sandaracinobacteroides hominis]